MVSENLITTPFQCFSVHRKNKFLFFLEIFWKHPGSKNVNKICTFVFLLKSEYDAEAFVYVKYMSGKYIFIEIPYVLGNSDPFSQSVILYI